MTSSLGFQSEYVINHLCCSVTETHDYSVLKTPLSPSYYFGNLLALKVPLHSKTMEQWQQLFRQSFAGLPGIEHQTFTWTREEPATSETLQRFIDANFAYEETHILSLKKQNFRRPDKLNENIRLKAIESDQDWQQWHQMQMAQMGSGHNKTALTNYLKSKQLNYRELAARGHGQYLGAFTGDRLIGYAGLYHLNGLGRFQHVHVLPEFENRKIAKTILTGLIDQSSDEIETLVIHADEHYHATKLYQSLGFEIAERECSLCWWPERDK